MRTEKELGAIRMMDALSAVDVDLLERCEEAGAAASGENRKTLPKERHGRRFIYRYAAACAACLCLIIAGAAYYGLSHLRMGSAKDGFSGESAKNNGSCVMENKAEEPEAVPMEAGGGDNGAAGSVSEELQSSMREPDWLDVNGLAVLPEIYELAKENGGTEKKAEEDALEAMREETMQNPAEAPETEGEQSSEMPPCQEMTCEPGADAVVPEGYSLVRAESGTEEPGGQESGLYEWSDGEHGLWLKITRTELTADLRFDMQPPVYTVQEEWRELLPDAGENGIIRFALLYENGMLAEYCGVLEQDEIIRLMESLAR